jgi:class 3 adenylate cyclase
MALFPGDSGQALEAAVSIRDSIAMFNGMRRDRGDPVKIAIGIHRGPLMLGTIGENLRMDSTVISDTVNTASRIEELAMKKEKHILVSAEIAESVAESGKYILTRIGKEKVKGKTREVEVFELEGKSKDGTEPRNG